MPDWEEQEEQEAVTRSFWTGTITFGLVSIPVALYAANRSTRVPLRMVGPGGTPLNMPIEVRQVMSAPPSE